MFAPVNNALTHNDFITVVQQRHGSRGYRPKLLPRNRLRPTSVHVWFVVDWVVLGFVLPPPSQQYPQTYISLI